MLNNPITEIIFNIIWLIISLIYLFFWLKTLLIMKNSKIGLLLGIFLSPFAQIAYYWHNRHTLNTTQHLQFKKFFLASIIWLALLTTFFIIVIYQAASQI